MLLLRNPPLVHVLRAVVVVGLGDVDRLAILRGSELRLSSIQPRQFEVRERL